MKVCMLTTSFPSYEGHPRTPFIYSLAKSLSKKVELDIVCPYYKNSKKDFTGFNVYRFMYWIPYFQTLTERGGIPSELRSSWGSRLQFPFFVISFALKLLMVGRKADVIHATPILSAAVALPLKWFFGKKIVLNERGSNLNMLKKNFFGRFLLKLIVSNVDYIVTNSKHQLELLSSIDKPKKVIYNGIEINKNVEKINKQRLIILFVGNLIKEKGVVDLIEALSEIRGLDFDCYFVGDGILRHTLEEKSKVLGVKAKFTGAIPFSSLGKYYNSADLFLFPSYEEGRPNVLIEAMGYEVPVVAYDIPGVNEIIKNNYNGVLVRLKDVHALSKAVESVFRDDKLRFEIKKNCAVWFKKNVNTWDKVANQFIKVYKEVL